MPYGAHECLRPHRGVDLTGKLRDLALAYYQYKVNLLKCQDTKIIENDKRGMPVSYTHLTLQKGNALSFPNMQRHKKRQRSYATIDGDDIRICMLLLLLDFMFHMHLTKVGKVLL